MESGKLVAVNRQILEIKKKIQLSEGQRKALFEICEAERKANADDILRFKKEIAELIVKLKENRSASAKNRIQQYSRLEDVVGHIGEKTCSEAKQILDLQIIDRSKQLDLLRYQAKKKQRRLTQLANDYRDLTSGFLQRFTRQKINTPIKKTMRELQNSIHAVQVQWREAEHVRIRYRDIRRSLQEDAAGFESNIRSTEEQLQAQQIDIDRLQQINAEANRIRGFARSVLLQEERSALKSAALRDRQATEGKRLIAERRLELEKLEKKIFQVGKAVPRPDTDGEDSNAQTAAPTPPLQPMESIIQAFEILKEATGGTNSDEVLERFCSQKETFERLCLLRKTGEEEKHQLEVKQENIAAHLETLKYAVVKDEDENAEEVEKLQEAIAEQKRRKIRSVQGGSETAEALKLVHESTQGICLNINPSVEGESDPLHILDVLESELRKIMKIIEEFEEKDRVDHLEVHEEKWLPTPYSGLIRRTPLPQQGTSATPAPPPGSDEDEEVPSRGYMKRQAQLVVDAKSRRKSIRFQMKK